MCIAERVYLFQCYAVSMTQSDAIQPKKRWSWTKRIFVTLAILGLIVLALWQYIHLPNYWDDKAISDADLMLVIPPPAPVKDNAATYIAIQNNLSESDDDILNRIPVYKDGTFSLNGVRLDTATVRAYVAESRALADDFVTASKQKVYQCPLTYGQNSFYNKPCSFLALRTYGDLTAFHARYHVSIGDYNMASAYTESLLRFGSLVANQDVPFALIEHLIGVALYGFALDILETNPKLVAFMQKRLPNYRISAEAQVNTFKSEYLSLKETILDGMVVTDSNGRIFSSYYHQPNRTINTLAEMWRINIKNVSTVCGTQIDDSEFKAYEATRKNETIFSYALKPNFTGRQLIYTVMASLGNVRDKRCEVNNRLEALAS